eukprot:scaffold5417_cov129-Isochrysis_galbana.AAC.2
MRSRPRRVCRVGWSVLGRPDRPTGWLPPSCRPQPERQTQRPWAGRTASLESSAGARRTAPTARDSVAPPPARAVHGASHAHGRYSAASPPIPASAGMYGRAPRSGTMVLAVRCSQTDPMAAARATTSPRKMRELTRAKAAAPADREHGAGTLEGCESWQDWAGCDGQDGPSARLIASPTAISRCGPGRPILLARRTLEGDKEQKEERRGREGELVREGGRARPSWLEEGLEDDICEGAGVECDVEAVGDPEEETRRAAEGGAERARDHKVGAATAHPAVGHQSAEGGDG